MNKELNLNESIIEIRVELQNSKIKKSGKNKFANFEYFELADFLPKLNELMKEYGINDIFTIDEEKARLILIKGEERQEYNMPFKIFDTPLNWKENKLTGEIEQVKSMQDIQYLGALNTYYKRYLYLNAFGITDGEVIDSLDNSGLTTKTEKKDYRQMLIDYCNEKEMDMNELAKEHKLHSKSTQTDFKKVLDKLGVK